jgi:hypothetical protein
VVMLRFVIVVAVCCLLGTPSVRAEGWLTSWMPGQKETTSTSRTSNTRSPLLGRKPLYSASKTAAPKPGMWDRMSRGTKNFFSRTKDALSWNDEPRSSRSSSRKDDESFFSGWFDNEPRPSKTVRGFMSQKRPESQYD